MGRVLILAQVPAALMVLYLDLLSIAAVRGRRTPPEANPNYRFAILVPAHNEEALLPRLLASLAALDYPHDRVDVHVVADTCTDRTADVARGAGVSVHERADAHQRGKGYALRWLLEELARQGVAYDAYVVVDADSVVVPSFLLVMNAYLLRGEVAIQGYYGVANAEHGWPAMLRYVALTLYNGLRPRGRAALGLSAGLRGNGMCFAAPIIERFGWGAFTLAEDVELHFQLVAEGIRVAYAPEASVRAEMPTTLRQARSQNLRWERGRLQMLRAFGPRLLHRAIERRDPACLDAVAEQLVPPLSVLTGITALTFIGSLVARDRAARRLATATLLGQLGYVATGLRLARATPRAYAALAMAPCYMLWKIGLYAVALASTQRTTWIRTARSTTDDAPPSL